MPESLTSHMEQFTASQLIDFFSELYIYEFGEKKAREIITKIADSDKVKMLMFHYFTLDVFPTSKDIAAYLNTIPYFIFSKGETLCLGALAVILLMENKISKDSNFTISWGKENTRLAVDVISDCSKLKINRGSGFFNKFYSEIYGFNPPYLK